MNGSMRGQTSRDHAGARSQSGRTHEGTHAASASAFAPGPGAAGGVANILALQRAAGNRAVNGLLARMMERSSSSTIPAIPSGGRPLDDAVRAEMESRFGQDLSEVQVHTGAEAAVVAGSLEAKAYTVGNDVVFSQGRYAPDTTEGKRLLAHELAHVVQQRRGGPAPALDPDSPLEQAADRASEGIGRDAGAVAVGGASGVGVARTDDDQPKPFDPQEGNLLAKILLYGYNPFTDKYDKDTPIRDFVTNDQNLKVAQDASAVVAITAATIATGGLAAEAAAGLGAGTVGAGAIGGATGGVFQVAAKGAYEGKDPTAEDYLKGAVIGAVGGGVGGAATDVAAGLGASKFVANVVGGAYGGVTSTATQGVIEGKDPTYAEYLKSALQGAGISAGGSAWKVPWPGLR